MHQSIQQMAYHCVLNMPQTLPHNPYQVTSQCVLSLFKTPSKVTFTILCLCMKCKCGFDYCLLQYDEGHFFRQAIKPALGLFGRGRGHWVTQMKDDLCLISCLLHLIKPDHYSLFVFEQISDTAYKKRPKDCFECLFCVYNYVDFLAYIAIKCIDKSYLGRNSFSEN